MLAKEHGDAMLAELSEAERATRLIGPPLPPARAGSPVRRRGRRSVGTGPRGTSRQSPSPPPCSHPSSPPRTASNAPAIHTERRRVAPPLPLILHLTGTQRLGQ